MLTTCRVTAAYTACCSPDTGGWCRTGVFDKLHCAAQGNLWKRKGWIEMDKMRSRLEDLKELRDLVRPLDVLTQALLDNSNPTHDP